MHRATGKRARCTGLTCIISQTNHEQLNTCIQDCTAKMVKVDKETLNFMRKVWKEPIDYGAGSELASPTNEQEPPVTMPPPPAPVAKPRLKKKVGNKPISTKPMSASMKLMSAKPSMKKPMASLPTSGMLGPYYYVGEKEDEEKKEPTYTINRNDASKMVQPPPETTTGVDPAILQIAACLSQQIYDATNKEYFRLEATTGDKELRKSEVHLFDSHGTLDPAIPAFAIASVGSTLILGWRGTNQILDFINDAAVAPVVSVDTGIRSHAMFSACVGSALRVHEEEILSLIVKKSIDTIVFTGHSLGGALANVAHLFVQASLGVQAKEGETGGSHPWNKKFSHLSMPLNLKTISFSAPMSTIDRDNVEDLNEKKVHNLQADNLLETVSSNSVNFVFSCDVVPRAYGHVFFVKDVIDKVGPELVRKYCSVTRFFDIDVKVSKAVIDFLMAMTEPLVNVAASFRHHGTILYYDDLSTATPIEVKDTGPGRVKKDDNGEVIIVNDKPIIVRSIEKDELNHYNFNNYRIENYVTTLLEAHSQFPKSFAPFISEKVNPDE